MPRFLLKILFRRLIKMDLDKLRAEMADCECGHKHDFDLEGLYIGSGVINDVGAILKKHDFPRRILMVADGNSFRVTAGLYERLLGDGFTVELRVYDDMKVADMREVEELEKLLARADGCLSVGTGSVNDICRLASFRAGKQFAIVATAPSMDGFASDSAPITKDGFKTSHPCRQPRVIIADTKILAESPNELKAAGFGDVMAKYIAIADWRVAALLHGDYYCERVAALVRRALEKMASLADKVSVRSEEAAGAIMETLVLTGIAMQLAKCTRPASGTEHIISHYWECKKLEMGKISDYHGKKVGVATLVVADIYHKLARLNSVSAHREKPDWADIQAHYGPVLTPDMMKLNEPDTIVNEIEPRLIEEKWSEIRNIIEEEIPSVQKLEKLYAAAGAVTSPEEIAVDRGLFEDGIKYHIYMRRRVTIMRLLPMLDIDPWSVYNNK
jgi:hypothetical protein